MLVATRVNAVPIPGDLSTFLTYAVQLEDRGRLTADVSNPNNSGSRAMFGPLVAMFEDIIENFISALKTTKVNFAIQVT